MRTEVSRPCSRCGKPIPEGLPGVYCRECRRIFRNASYHRALFERRLRGTFVCRECGRTLPTRLMSAMVADRCLYCQSEIRNEALADRPATMVCVVCGEEKPSSDFPTYRKWECKGCYAKKVKAWHEKEYKRLKELGAMPPEIVGELGYE